MDHAHRQKMKLASTLPPPHPAKFSEPILERIRPALEPDWLILDPFAGVGLVHTLSDRTIGIEIEPEWASAHPRTICANSMDMPLPDRCVQCIVTSPTYGNRMSDHHEAKDNSQRYTYRHLLGRPLSSWNTGSFLCNNPLYTGIHDQVYAECYRVLDYGGLFILNISDHMHHGKQVRVSDWHIENLCGQGFTLLGEERIPTKRMRNGENRDARVTYELLVTFEKEAA